MLTARDALPNRISGLNAGADDYLTKPFAFEELMARLRAITRGTDVLLSESDRCMAKGWLSLSRDVILRCHPEGAQTKCGVYAA